MSRTDSDADQPRALVIGSWPHVPGHLTSGSASALAALGYQVAVHDPLRSSDALAFKLANRARLRLRSLRAVLRPWQNRSVVRAARSFRPDLVLVIRGEMLTESTICTLSAAGAQTVNWCPDDPYQHGTELEAAAAYDHLFVFDPHYIPALRDAGARDVHYLSMACAPDVQRPLELTRAERERYGAQVVFVGSHYPNREDALRRLGEFELAIWGGGWQVPLARPGHPLRRCYRGRAMGVEMVKIYNASRIVINVQHPQSVYAQNMRTFEAPACGALTITPYTEELPRLYDIGREIVDYRTIDELVEKTRHYLAHPEETATIAARGRVRAARDHSYRARMQQLLEAIDAPRAVAAA